MKLMGKQLLEAFKQKHADARQSIDSWKTEVEEANWQTPSDLKRKYPKASIIGHQHALFNICGNRYRLWISIAYKSGVALVKRIGTHKEYDDWEIR